MKWLSSKMVSPITQIIEQHNISRYTTTLPYSWDVGLVERMTVQPKSLLCAEVVFGYVLRLIKTWRLPLKSTVGNCISNFSQYNCVGPIPQLKRIKNAPCVNGTLREETFTHILKRMETIQGFIFQNEILERKLTRMPQIFPDWTCPPARKSSLTGFLFIEKVCQMAAFDGI